MRTRLNLTVDEELVRKCRKYNINVSKAVDRIMLEKIKQETTYLEEEQNRPEFKKCSRCLKPQDWTELTAVAHNVNNEPEAILCKDCLASPWEKTNQTIEQYCLKRWCLIPISGIIHRRVEAAIKRDLR